MTTARPTHAGRRRSRPPTSHQKAQRSVDDGARRRYENAWDDCVGYEPPSDTGASGWRRLRSFAGSRSGRVVFLAPMGALGAFLFLRRRR